MTVYSYKAQPANLSLIVVSGMGLSLFGRNWLTTLCLDWKSIGIVASQIMLERHSEVFKGGLGKLIGHKAKLYVDSDTKP